MKFLILKTVKPKGVCCLGSIQNVADADDLTFGKSFLGRWPDKAQFTMDSDFPRDIALADNLDNISMRVVVSAAFKEALEGIPGALHCNEVLPVKIINHKKRAEKAPYFVIHQVDHPPCLDEAKSDGKRFAMNPKLFQLMKKMVLDPKKIDSKLMLFRPAQYNMYPLVRQDLADKLKALKLSGVEFRDIEGYAF